MLTLIVVGVWTGLGIYLMFQGGLEMAVSGLVFILVGLVWAWFQLWLPKAVVTSTELRVVNRLRIHRIPLEEIASTVERAPLATFILTNGRRVSVSAIDGWYFSQKWNPALARHAAAFVEAVFKARDQKMQASR